MLSAAAVDLTSLDDDDWGASAPAFHYRVASVNSWGVTSIGRGFQWSPQKEDAPESPARPPKEPLRELPQVVVKESDELLWSAARNHGFPPSIVPSYTMVTPTQPPMITTSAITTEPFSDLPPHSRPPSPRSPAVSPTASPNRRGSLSRSPSSPVTRPRRRSSQQQRVSLIAGRVSIAPMEPSSPPLLLAPSLQRAGSTSSYLSVAASTGPPTPYPERETFLGSRRITDFAIESEIGRGAYGLVKRGREIQADGTLGPPAVIKQVIKSRILADCWKKHPKHGTIPIEIYVMSAISSTSYILPPVRPWDPSRLASQHHQDAPTNCHNRLESDNADDDTWVEGKTVKGHPNICPLLDFFEDDHYYYLLLPSSTPERNNHGPPPPSDLFDLVEGYPNGLPPNCIRSFVGQIADALCFLHSRGIVHRDVKDENVVLGPGGKCILIDFGSSGLVRKNGWDTFSGTLDYAGPEILRGERYHGKEQDVWAFGVVLYVLLVGECPFMTAAEAQEGLTSPFANASIALDERCADGKEQEGEEEDGGGSLGDAAVLVRACLQVDVPARPTFEKILESRFLAGSRGW